MRHGWMPPRYTAPVPRVLPPPGHTPKAPSRNGGAAHPRSSRLGSHHAQIMAVMSPATGAGSVAMRTMLPERGSFRFSGMYASAPTAVARPFSLSPYDFGGPPVLAAADAFYPLGSTTVFLRRSALQAVIKYVRNEPAYNWSMETDYFGAGHAQLIANGGTTHLSPPRMRRTGVPVSDHLLPEYMWNPSHIDPNGGDRRAIFISASTLRQTTITINRFDIAAAPADDWEVIVYKLTGDAWRNTSSYLYASGVSTWALPVNESGYYAFDIVTPVILDNNASYLMSVIIAGSSDTWRIEAIPNLVEHMGNAHQIRVNATSLLFSPVTAQSERAGQVVCAQVAHGTSWHQYASEADFSENSNVTALPFTKGVFGYVKPGSDRSYEFSSVLHYDSDGLLINVTEHLLTSSDTVAFSITVPISATVDAYPAALVNLTHVAAVEYTSSSTWIQSYPPEMSPEAFERAISAIRGLPQFFENETHKEQILRFLKAGAFGVLEYGPTVLRVAQLLAALL